MTSAQRAGKGASVGHWATKMWNTRKVQKELGIFIHPRDLTEFEMTILEYCESTYQGMMAPRRGGAG